MVLLRLLPAQHRYSPHDRNTSGAHHSYARGCQVLQGMNYFDDCEWPPRPRGAISRRRSTAAVSHTQICLDLMPDIHWAAEQVDAAYYWCALTSVSCKLCAAMPTLR